MTPEDRSEVLDRTLNITECLLCGSRWADSRTSSGGRVKTFEGRKFLVSSLGEVLHGCPDVEWE